MPTIAIHEPAPQSAVSYYRSLGTLPYLSKKNNKIKFKILDTVSWDSLSGVDILYMQRPQMDSDLTAFNMAKDFNVKVWVDYDDNLFKVPAYNPSYAFYTKTHALKNVEKALCNADVISVSTPAIKDYFLRFNNNIKIVENSHNDYQYPFNKIEQTTQTVCWRGSPTHRRDLLSCSRNMFSLSKIYEKEWSWVFIGNDIWYITNFVKNMFNLAECAILDYNKFILDLKAAIQIVPLLDNEFNHSKSNIGWLEGTYAGSCTIGPAIPEFMLPGCINYLQPKEPPSFDDCDNLFQSNESFGYLLEKAIKSKKFRQEYYIRSYEYIKENLLLSQINQKRLDIVEELL